LETSRIDAWIRHGQDRCRDSIHIHGFKRALGAPCRQRSADQFLKFASPKCPSKSSLYQVVIVIDFLCQGIHFACSFPFGVRKVRTKHAEICGAE
jgi:hypothetical protein